MSTGDRPLAGVRVVDFTRIVAGPLATRILADQGAEIIKVEPPEGDLARTFPPVDADDITPYFAQQNAGKRFCSIDLRAEGGPELVARLVAEADVVIENYRPGVLAKFDLDADTLCTRHPGLVYCSVTGFGQTGEWAHRRAYAPIGHLEAGVIDFEQRAYGGPARQLANAHGDVYTAMLAAASINALLVKQARTGQGGRLDLSMVESLLFANEWVATELAGGYEFPNGGAAFESPILELPDGQRWGLGGAAAAWWDPLMACMERPDLADDPKFATLEARGRNHDELIQIITEWASSFDSFDAFRDRLESMTQFTAAELRSVQSLAQTPWAAQRDIVATTDVGYAVPARPAVGENIGTTGHVGTIGSDNREVLEEVLGLGDAEIDELSRKGVLIEKG